nr:unnamed protein product [Callosobruchus analis]
MSSYYEVLNVPVNASIADIKKAYKQLALRWHPDKNPDKLEEATRIFREISKAYEVLSDKVKRETYDMRSYNFLPKRPSSEAHVYQRGRFNFRDPEEVFREFFRGSMCEFLKETVRYGKLNKIPCSNCTYGSTVRRHDVGDYMDRPLFTPPFVQDSCLFGNVYGYQSVSSIPKYRYPRGKTLRMMNSRVQINN